MRLLGNAFRESELLQRLEERLRARGLWHEPEKQMSPVAVEPRVDPLSFNLAALEEHADPTRPLPLQTHRGRPGAAGPPPKWAFRTTWQVLINETLPRQRLFNGHVRDSYAQLSAEVLRLRAQLDKLQTASLKKRAVRRRRPA